LAELNRVKEDRLLTRAAQFLFALNYRAATVRERFAE
jgi:hypothetical protein